MAKFSNSGVVLLMLLIAAWRTMPVLSHFFQPSKPAAGSDFDYGRRVKTENKASTPDAEFSKAAGEAAVLLRAKQELSKRMVEHIETIIGSPKIMFHMKLVLLIKSAEFMRAMAGDVVEQMAIVGQQHAKVASADIVAALRLQQEILKKTIERCKAVYLDAAIPQKEKYEIVKGVARDLSTVAGDIAISFSTLAEDAVGVSGHVAAGVDIDARVEIESQALAKAEAKAVVEAIADDKALDKVVDEALAGAKASAGAGGEAKASKSNRFIASGDAGGYEGGKTDADATTSGGTKAGVSGKADVDASARVGGEAEASKSNSFSTTGDAGGYEGGKIDTDATTSGGGTAGDSGKVDIDASPGAGGDAEARKSSSFSASGDAKGYEDGKTSVDAITSGGVTPGGSSKANVDASAGTGGEAKASKSASGDAGGYEGGKTNVDATTSSGDKAGGNGKENVDASVGTGGLNY